MLQQHVQTRRTMISKKTRGAESDDIWPRESFPATSPMEVKAPVVAEVFEANLDQRMSPRGFQPPLKQWVLI